MTLEVVSSAPPDIRDRYTNGGCYVMARHLSAIMGLPIWGLFLKRQKMTDCWHVMVVDEGTKTAYDINGAWPLVRTPQGRLFTDGYEAVPLTPDMEHYCASVFHLPSTNAAMRQAETDARRWLSGTSSTPGPGNQQEPRD